MFNKCFIISLLGLSLLGCGEDDSNGTSTDDVKGNLFITDVVMETSQVMGHKDQFTLAYTLHVENITEQDVNVDFYMLDTSSTATDVGNTSVDINNAHMVMSTTIENISSGIYQQSIDINVPNTQGMAGNYMMVALVDPNNDIEETNEEDNWPTLELIDSMGEAERAAMQMQAYSSDTMEVIAPAANDIIIDEYDIGQSAIIFDTPDHMTESNLMSNLVGYIEARFSGEGMADAVLEADALINGEWQPLAFWNMSADADGTGEYQTVMPYVFDQEHNEAHMGFDIAFENTYLVDLYSQYDSSVQNKITIRFNLMPDESMGFEDSNTDNNMVEVTIPYYFFEDTRSQSSPKSSIARVQQISPAASAGTAFIDLNKSYNKTYGNKSKIAAEIELEGGVSVDPIRAGGSAYANGGFNVHMFKAKNVIVGVDFHADAYLLDETGYALEMTFLNTTVFSTEKTKKRKNEEDLPTWTLAYEKEWERSRDIVKSRFFVGPIPLSVTAGVSGNVGFGIEAGYRGNLFIAGDLFSAEFSGYARGGIDFVLVQAGIQISITVIENNFTLDSSLGLTLAQNTFEPVITYQVSLIDELDVIKGKFGLFAKVNSIKWCKKWFIYYPCGKSSKTFYFWFYQTPSLFHKEFTLYSKEGTIDL